MNLTGDSVCANLSTSFFVSFGISVSVRYGIVCMVPVKLQDEISMPRCPWDKNGRFESSRKGKGPEWLSIGSILISRACVGLRCEAVK